MNYYNENDPRAAAWLRELISAKHIPQGIVDERSIIEVTPAYLAGFTQCHFFAGIGGWSLALRLAGWPETRPVWTGSCPCQPFSQAGKGHAEKDKRHLWPFFRELIRGGKPPVVFGEQVASKAGRQWLAGVFADLETMGYQRAGADLCAASQGAPHIRQRLFWVANAESIRGGKSEKLGETKENSIPEISGQRNRERFIGSDSTTGRLAHAANGGCSEYGEKSGARQNKGPRDATERFANCGLGDAHGSGFGQQCGPFTIPPQQPSIELRSNAWDSFDLLPCTDGKTRRIESGTFPLAHGVPARVGRLRGYGNAIVPQVAAEFISAFLDIEP